jgi:hypothetical protein
MEPAMRLAAPVVALGLVLAGSAGGSARAETLQLVCRGLVTDTSSHEQTKRAEPFEVLIDLEGKTVLFNGEAMTSVVIRDDKISFVLPKAPPPNGKIRRFIRRGLSKLLPQPGPYELDRRSGFWRNRGASGICSKPDPSQNQF